MSKISLRRLLSRLTAIALSTSAVAPATAEPGDPGRDREVEQDDDRCSADESDAAGRDLALELTADLVVDREHAPPPEAAFALGRSLALAIDHMRPLDATHVVATWALAPDPVRRLAVAHALAWPFPLVGDDVAIDHLSRDPDPSIRTAAARAAWMRRSRGADEGVIDRLAVDPDPTVRMVAASARGR